MRKAEESAGTWNMFLTAASVAVVMVFLTLLLGFIILLLVGLAFT